MNFKIFLITIITLISDQISKILITLFLKLNEQVTIIPNFFNLHFIENYGASWNILNNHTLILIICSILALLIIYKYMFNFQKNKRNNLAFGLLLGGIFGNLIDRVFLGYVRDFLSFRIFKYNYPVFNLADVAIVLGVILLIIAIFKGEDKIEVSSKR